MSLDLFTGNDAEWMAQPGRKCITGNPDLWFPTEPFEKAATRLCDGCEVIDACRAWATERPEIVGIWGGTTTHRRQLDRNASAGDAA